MQKSLLSLSLSLLVLILTASCGWKLHPALNKSEKSYTISIPYVEGDPSGKLTAQLVETIQREGGFRYVHSGGRLILKVKLIDNDILNIGWKVDPSRDNQKIIPNESRKKLLAEVTVLQEGRAQPLIGPVFIKSFVDYDHQHYALNNDANIFSLGQLTDIDTARDGLDTPMYRAMALEINNFLLMHQEELSL